MVNKLKGKSSRVLILQAKKVCYLQTMYIIYKSGKIWKLRGKVVILCTLTGHKKVVESADRTSIFKTMIFKNINISIEIGGAWSMFICLPLV